MNRTPHWLVSTSTEKYLAEIYVFEESLKTKKTESDGSGVKADFGIDAFPARIPIFIETGSTLQIERMWTAF